MARRRVQFAAAVTALAVGASALVSSPALGDGTTTTPIKCTGIPLLGSIDADMAINATDDVDPVMIGGSVKLLLKVPIPIGEIPVDITLSEGKITTPIPAGVSVTNVSFTSSSFPNKTWAVSGSNLVLTLSGNVTLGQGKPAPVMPDVTVTAKVSGVPRVISWKVPSSFGIKGSVSGLGSLNANCTPNNANTVMATTTVKAAAQAPVAHDQTIPVPFGQPANIVLSGTDVNNDPLTYDVATQPAHGTLSGTAPNLTYTPNPGYFGPDAFDFTVSDPTSGDNGTITLDVSPNPITIPSAPVITGVDLLGAGAGRIRWSAPSSNGGSALSGYRVSVVQNGVTTEVGTFSTSLSSATSLQLTDGVPAVFKVVALNAAGEGIVATAPAITPQWWLPWSSGQSAVNEIFTWMTGKAPTATQRQLWLQDLNMGLITVPDLIENLRSGSDAINNVDPTIRLYSAYLTRVPDAGGLNFWLARRRSGWTLSRISSNFAASSEFVRRYGNMSNRQFVQNIYAYVMERAGDTAGINFWTSRLDSGQISRGQLMINFSESSEYKRKQANNVDGAAVYIQVLGRTPTAAQRSAFVTGMQDVGFVATTRALLRESSFATRAG
ncbi:MAG: DUF4214 domain-containing protein [Acidimicrobiales bacterium]|nr:DUF4214 domain-containing protein [Acidimicrobiales bacterium]